MLSGKTALAAFARTEVIDGAIATKVIDRHELDPWSRLALTSLSGPADCLEK